MSSQQSQHLYDRLAEYAGSDFYPYHMPGHKRRAHGKLPGEWIDMDITEIEGFDDLHHPEEILAGLQREAAALYGAEESFYLVGGSTCGVQAAISAAVPRGGRLLMARNCHRSAYHTVYLRQICVSYLFPSLRSAPVICEAITPGEVQEALEREEDIDAVMIVSPTYEGRIADVAAIAEIVHAKGIPLIVDEAHGAHLGLAEGFAPNSCQAGADIVIHSVHKTLPAMTQTALLHVNGTRIERDRLRRFLRIYQTSSPSYVLMASIDNTLQMAREEKEMFVKLRQRFAEMLERLSACSVLTFLTGDATEQDIGKLVISTADCHLTGKELADRLREEYHLELELAGEDYALAMFTVGDTEEGYERMTRALLSLDQTLAEQMDSGNVTQTSQMTQALQADIFRQSGSHTTTVCEEVQEELQPVLPLSTAWDQPWEKLPLQQAQGRYAGEFIQLYPPGIPIVVPGEPITSEKYDKIVTYIEKHLNVQGVEFEKGNIWVKVLKNLVSG